MKENLRSLWKTPKENFDSYEKALIDCYIAFLKKVAEFYLNEGRRVFFRENTVVHWGEGNFGSLIIEGGEDMNEVFGDFISEISFEPEITEKILRGFKEIKKENIQDIRYIKNY
jgi:hypothetical protein